MPPVGSGHREDEAQASGHFRCPQENRKATRGWSYPQRTWPPSGITNSIFGCATGN